MAEKREAKGEEGEEGAAAPAAAAPKSKLPLGLIAGAIGLMVVSAGVPTAILLPKIAKEAAHSDLPPGVATDEAKATLEGSLEEEQLAEDEERLGAIFPLDTFIVNIAGGKFLRTQVQLEFVGQDVPPRLYQRIPLVRDGLIMLFGQKTPEELGGEKGRAMLRKEVQELVNEILKKEEVKRVYFTQFVIQ